MNVWIQTGIHAGHTELGREGDHWTRSVHFWLWFQVIINAATLHLKWLKTDMGVELETKGSYEMQKMCKTHLRWSTPWSFGGVTINVEHVIDCCVHRFHRPSAVHHRWARTHTHGLIWLQKITEFSMQHQSAVFITPSKYSKTETYYINVASEVCICNLSPSQSIIHCDMLLIGIIATVHCILAQVVQGLGCHATE